MKFYYLLFLLIITTAHATNWEQPPIVCVEDLFPKGYPCLDFSKVKDVFNDFPESTTVAEMEEWKTYKSADLRYCRNLEVLRRESHNPGSFSANTLELSWMVVNGYQNSSDKIEAIYSASKKYSIPPHILIGALRQESLLATLGISPDGGNFSCGIAQLNIQEWCRYMNGLPESILAQLNWPQNFSCSEETLPTSVISPFYKLALKKIKDSKPDYQISKVDFSEIKIEDIFPKSEENEKLFQASMSFINHCQDIELSIMAKARTLKSLYDNYVPESLKKSENYTGKDIFQRSCQLPYELNQFPLHTGWLLSVAMYNAGPIEVKLLDHYYGVKKDLYPLIHPDGLIEALHWGGKWKSKSKLIEFKDQTGKLFTQSWFKSCIVQRHVARVIQHVTQPVQSIVKSLEMAPCSPGAEVPEYRQKSSGVKFK